MKVKELIAALKDQPQDYEIVCGDDYRTFAVVDVGDDTSKAERQVYIEISRTGGKDN